MFIHLQPRVLRCIALFSALLSWLVPLAAVLAQRCIIREQLTLMQLG